MRNPNPHCLRTGTSAKLRCTVQSGACVIITRCSCAAAHITCNQKTLCPVYAPACCGLMCAVATKAAPGLSTAGTGSKPVALRCAGLQAAVTSCTALGCAVLTCSVWAPPAGTGAKLWSCAVLLRAAILTCAVLGCCCMRRAGTASCWWWRQESCTALCCTPSCRADMRCAGVLLPAPCWDSQLLV